MLISTYSTPSEDVIGAMQTPKRLVPKVTRGKKGKKKEFHGVPPDADGFWTCNGPVFIRLNFFHEDRIAFHISFGQVPLLTLKRPFTFLILRVSTLGTIFIDLGATAFLPTVNTKVG